MQELHKLLAQLESDIACFDKVNLAVSSGSVGWHMAHSLKTIDQIFSACKHSNPTEYQWRFNFKRLLIMSIMKKFPRGKAKAPKIVRPEGDISPETLSLDFVKVRKNLNDWDKLDKNAHFPHPFFGMLNKKKTETFLVLHTKHHVMIVKDILK